MDEHLLRHLLDAAAAAQIRLQRRQVLPVVIAVVFDDGRQRLVRQVAHQVAVLDQIEHPVQSHPVKILQRHISRRPLSGNAFSIACHWSRPVFACSDSPCFRHPHSGPRAFVSKMQVLDIRHLVTHTDHHVPVRNLHVDAAGEGINDLRALRSTHRVHDDHEMRRVVEKMSVMRQIGQIKLHPVSDPFALHGVHPVEVAR